MDAFAVSIVNGITLKKINRKFAVIYGLSFGGFQGVLPLLGYYLANTLSLEILKYDHWIAFIVLSAIGLNMINESLSNKKIDMKKSDFNFFKVILLGITVSIDAFAVGVTFSLLKNTIIFPSIIFALISFAVSYVGIILGKKIGNYNKKVAEFSGGVLLIIMGLLMLFKHLF